jgi:hypothetical protein
MTIAAIPLPPRRQLEAIVALLDSQAAAARVLSKRYASEISRLLGTDRRPNRTTCAQINSAYLVVSRLAEQGYEGREIAPVLTQPWVALDGRAPSELIAAGDADSVIEAIERQFQTPEDSMEDTPKSRDAAPWTLERHSEISRNVQAQLTGQEPLDEDYVFLTTMSEDEAMSFAGAARRTLEAASTEADYEAYLDAQWESFAPPPAPAPATAEREAEPLHAKSVIELDELLLPGGAMASRRFEAGA